MPSCDNARAANIVEFPLPHSTIVRLWLITMSLATARIAAGRMLELVLGRNGPDSGASAWSA